MTEWKRRIARVAAVLAVALGAGHLVQTKAAHERAVNSLNSQPEAIEPVAAGPEKKTSDYGIAGLNDLPKVPLKALEAPKFDPPAVQVIAPATTGQATADCPVALDLVAQPAAMVGVGLVAPCHVSERVVVQQSGLTFTAMTNVTGSLFVDVPALQSDTVVTVVFPDGSRVDQSILMADLSSVRRFAIQWQQDDAFLLHGFEGGAGYGTPGDIWAGNTRSASGMLPPSQGFMTLLGDAAAPSPLLAAVYTYPANAATRADIVVEAAIDRATCGRELLGQTLASSGGRVQLRDLAVTMPDCDAAGGYLVLKNLAPETNIAAN